MSDPRKDVLIEILKRVPLKSAWRLRSVSAEWFSVITDPDFIRSHHPTVKTLTLPLDSGAGGSREWLTYDPASFVPVAATSELLDDGLGCSARGLVCVGSKDAHDIHVLNPATGEFISIGHPPLPGIRSPSFRYQFFFGFDPVANQHKVLYSCYDPELFLPTDVTTQHWIFTLGGAEEWRMAAVQGGYHEKSFFHGEVCANGVIYFLGFKYDPNRAHPGYYLSAFDLRTESFSTVKLSAPYGNGRFQLHAYRWSLIEYDGSVALLENGLDNKLDKDSRSYGAWINLWTLEDFHNQVWVSKVSILAPPAWLKTTGVERLRLACARLCGNHLIFVPIETREPSFDMFFFNVETNDLWKESMDVPAGDVFVRSFDSGVVVYSDHIGTLLSLLGSPRILGRSIKP